MSTPSPGSRTSSPASPTIPSTASPNFCRITGPPPTLKPPLHPRELNNHPSRRFSAAYVFTREEHPQTWGRLQNALGGVFVSWPAYDDARHLETALAHYNAAFEVFTQRDYPE